MDINFTLVAQAIAFFVLIVFTMKFVWPPLLNAIETRQKEIADGLAAGYNRCADVLCAEGAGICGQGSCRQRLNIRILCKDLCFAQLP